MVLFTIGTTIFGVSFIPFSIAIPSLFTGSKISKILSIIGSVLGYFVALGIIMIAATPHTYSDLINFLHMVGVYTAYASIFLSTLLYAISTFFDKSIKNAYGIIAVIFCTIFLATLIMGLMGIGGSANNLIQQIGQKVGRGLTVLTYIILCIPLLKSNE
jgi:hypothetical protein